MAKLTKKKFLDYKNAKENGFIVNLHKLIYQFAYGDEYPKFQQSIYTEENEDETIKIYIEISFFKFNSGRSEYRIKAQEWSFNKELKYGVSGTGYFEKTYHKEDGGRFSFKHLKELCHMYKADEIKETVLKDYEDYKIKKGVA